MVEVEDAAPMPVEGPDGGDGQHQPEHGEGQQGRVEPATKLPNTIVTLDCQCIPTRPNWSAPTTESSQPTVMALGSAQTAMRRSDPTPRAASRRLTDRKLRGA